MIIKTIGRLFRETNYKELKQLVDSEYESMAHKPVEADNAAAYIDHYIHMCLVYCGIHGQSKLDRMHDDIVNGNLNHIAKLLNEADGWLADDRSAYPLGLYWY